MRIDTSSSTAAAEIANESIASKVGTQKASKAIQSFQEDTATLTSDSTSVGSLVTSALNTPPVRQGLVDSLKQSVHNGTYELNPSKIASSIIDEHA